VSWNGIRSTSPAPTPTSSPTSAEGPAPRVRARPAEVDEDHDNDGAHRGEAGGEAVRLEADQRARDRSDHRELTRATAAELDDLVELEELNKTTIVNRALQVYAFLRKAERDGAQILLAEADAPTPQRLHFL
jgi:hypothetical protein